MRFINADIIFSDSLKLVPVFNNYVFHFLIIQIPITEEYWHVGNRDGPNPNQLQFLAILADVGQLSVSAGFTEVNTNCAYIL